MKLNTKVGGICASLTFLITAIPGFYQQARPTAFNFIASDSFSGMAVVETLAISLLGAMAAWMIGYIIGDILSHPQKVVKPQASPIEAPVPSPLPPPNLPDKTQDEVDPEGQSELSESPDPVAAPSESTDDLE
jgi:hypothetical protein